MLSALIQHHQITSEGNGALFIHGCPVFGFMYWIRVSSLVVLCQACSSIFFSLYMFNFCPHSSNTSSSAGLRSGQDLSTVLVQDHCPDARLRVPHCSPNMDVNSLKLKRRLYSLTSNSLFHFKSNLLQSEPKQ